MLRHNWIYSKILYEENYFNESEEFNQNLNDQFGHRFTRVEAVDLLDSMLKMIIYFLKGT